MTNLLEEPAVEKCAKPKAEPPDGCIATHEMAKQIGRTVHDAQIAVSDTLQEGKKTAERLWKNSRTAINDCVGETAGNIKRHPFASVTIALAAGAVLGLVMPRAWGWKRYLGARLSDYRT